MRTPRAGSLSLVYLGWLVAVSSGCGRRAMPGVVGPDGGEGPADAEAGADTDGAEGGVVAAAGKAIGAVVEVFDTYRAQIADIVPLGVGHFVVGYRDPDDRLTYVRWNERGRIGTAAEQAGDGLRWVRADTTDGFSRRNPTCIDTGEERVNTLAVELGADNPTVRLDVHRNCAGHLTFTSVTIAPGVKPSAVTVPTDGSSPARTLVVYGRGPQLLARFVVHAATPEQAPTVEGEFPILRFTLGSAFSTDVIHNRHSNRFIVGFIQRGGLGCSIWNVALDAAAHPPTVLGGPTQFGGCDGDQGGHHTSVAYNPHGDGRYAWWRQDMNLVKAVFIHDATGAVMPSHGPLTADVVQFGNLSTAPVASTGLADPLYAVMFGQPSVHLYDMDAAGSWTDRVPAFGPAIQAALRVMPSGVVGLVRVRDKAAPGTATLRLLRAPAGEPAEAHQ